MVFSAYVNRKKAKILQKNSRLDLLKTQMVQSQAWGKLLILSIIHAYKLDAVIFKSYYSLALLPGAMKAYEIAASNLNVVMTDQPYREIEGEWDFRRLFLKKI